MLFRSSSDAQKAERDSYLQEAQQAESGCDFHFWQSGKRLMQNGSLIPPEKAENFQGLLWTMTGKSTSLVGFNDAVATIQRSFPHINSWLSWWLRGPIASMTFPGRSAVDPDVADQIPSTANEAEHSHSLLHHTVGKDHDLIPGIKNLFLHVKELEKQYEAISGRSLFILWYRT